MAGDPFGDLHGRLGEGELVRLRLELEASRELIEELRKEKEAERAKVRRWSSWRSALRAACWAPPGRHGASFRVHLAFSQMQTQLAEEQVEVLERNLSSLFTTAKLEIKRKDEEIARLRAMCVRGGGGGGCAQGRRVGTLSRRRAPWSCSFSRRSRRLKTAWESLDAAAPADASSAGPGGFGGPPSVAGSRPQAWSGRP